MNTIGSKISSAASAINPFEGTVNTEETSRDGLKFLGVQITPDKSMGNFTLRKIYNSIVNAPGHAFNAVGLKSFTNYLYPKTKKENLGTITAPAEKYTGSSLKATRENQVVIHTKTNNEVRDVIKEEKEDLNKLLRGNPLDSKIAKYALKTKFSKPEDAYLRDIDSDSEDS
jgi:hypothetical protein